MRFISTRNGDLSVLFSQAVRECTPLDGGTFVPYSIEDMRKWIYYINESTSFTSIAGSLTSAFINDEYSPIICEKIATDAFPFEPNVVQLDENLFQMQLYTGFTGQQRDFGISYLCSYLENTLQLEGEKAVFLDFTFGGLGSILAKCLRGKKNIKAILVFQKGTVQGFDEEDFVWNGGNIYPVEMDAPIEQIRKVIHEIYDNEQFVVANKITIANTTNVCRMLGQLMYFPYSFSRIKNRVSDDIYYALNAGNYGTIMAALYSWRFALPLSGIFTPSTNELTLDSNGKPVIYDCSSEVQGRKCANPLNPANLERLKYFFKENDLMMRNFVYPTMVTEKDIVEAAKVLYKKYGVVADKDTASAYACVLGNKNIEGDDESAIVLLSNNHPAYSNDFCKTVYGRELELPVFVRDSLKKVELNRPLVSSAKEIMKIVEKM
jgi:threonine synthase